MTLDRVHSSALLTVVVISLGWCVVSLVSERLDVRARQPIDLNNRINPNQASVGSLIRLTGIGLARAQSMVAFREAYKEHHPLGIPYRTLQDLEQIKGIGPAIVEDISTWLDLTSEIHDH